MNERTNVEVVELFIIEALSKGENVVIPDFGHLELKSIGENRRTVFFRPNGDDDSFLRVMSPIAGKEKTVSESFRQVISSPLKEGKLVNLQRIGIFRPVSTKQGGDNIEVSFILASYLRKLLNGGETETEVKIKEDAVAEHKEETVEMFFPVETTEESQNSKITLSKENVDIGSDIEQAGIVASKFQENRKNDQVIRPLKSKTDFDTYKPRKESKVGDKIIPDDNNEVPERNKSRGVSGSLLIILILMALILTVIVYVVRRQTSTTQDGNQENLTPPSGLVSLPSLAEQHYGHPAFWVYIYEANIDKLNSPVNISKTIPLVIPDIKNEYDVDVTDSLEIKRANILSDIVLKKEKVTIRKK